VDYADDDRDTYILSDPAPAGGTETEARVSRDGDDGTRGGA